MLINNTEVKTGDCIIACAIEPDGYHYMLGFAFKIGEIIDGKTKCTFHCISSDDLVVREFSKLQEFGDLSFPPAYDIYVVTEESMNQYVNKIQQAGKLEEDEAWEYFEEANQNAIKTIQKYRD